jgi:hypothetical protein
MQILEHKYGGRVAAGPLDEDPRRVEQRLAIESGLGRQSHEDREVSEQPVGSLMRDQVMNTACKLVACALDRIVLRDAGSSPHDLDERVVPCRLTVREAATSQHSD